MKRGIILLAVILALVCYVGPAQGAIITIAIEAVVHGVHDPDNHLEGLVNIGDLISGTYTYDTGTLDSSSSVNVGRYEHYSYPCGFSLSVVGLHFMTDPGNTNFVIRILDDYLYDDFYWLTSYNNLPLSNGTSVNNIEWVLGDPSETAVSSIELPVTAPVLDAWEVNYLNIEGPGTRDNILFQAHVTSAVVIPEPSTILLLGFGAIALVRKVKK